MDLEIELAALEFQWCEADELVKAARTELAASEHKSAVVIDEIRKRVARAERKKQAVMKKINALEEYLDSAQLG
jgi:hypothetical protein